ncbi:MAG: DNA topoisomerase IB [Gammaproteobacteria bacterium]|nr:DNA topoisomerase IB [Gammaproteobacteria bacterium]
MSRVVTRDAGLRHVRDDAPGLRRLRHGEGFRYVDAEGRPVRDRAVLARIRALAIPPAWTDVWICPSAHGHLQATGRDARGRKQYRYHAAWRSFREETKYGRLVAFAGALPGIRARVAADLAQPGLSRERVLATVVRLLELTNMRAGNDEYARTNGTFGLTTLRNRHVRIEGATLSFDFKGKSGKRHSIELTDRRLSRLVARCRELPGYELFQYVDAAGEVHAVDSGDLNAYLREAAGADYTAKDFRTWGGTRQFARAMRGAEPGATLTESRSRLKALIGEVAAVLGNTPAICRKSYVHPALIEGYLAGELPAALVALRDEDEDEPHGLSAEERALVRYLSRRAGVR